MRYRCQFAAVAIMLAPVVLSAQESDSADVRPVHRIQPVEASDPLSNDRILGVIPNYTTVSDSAVNVAPLTRRQKFTLFVKETIDPFTFVSAGMGAAMSQAGDNTPKYGVGSAAYGERFGAALADMATQNFFADAVLASALHQDPRYYRMGPAHSVPRRVVYSMTRLILTRQDSGRANFNFSCVGGMAMGIALSNSYYPSRSVSGSVTEARFLSSVSGAAFGNLLPEFWPDIKQKLAHFRHTKQSGAIATN